MTDLMSHKGYHGSVHYSDDDEVFFGKVEFIRDLISYEGKDVKTLKKAFKGGVDDYLALCAKRGQEPERPFKGSFNIRTGTDLHRQLALYAKEKHLNLNQVVIDALKQYLPSSKKTLPSTGPA